MAQRKFTYIPFDRMECPMKGCSVGGSVPGVKRHFGFMHPEEPEPNWPKSRSVRGINKAVKAKLVSQAAVRKAAKQRGMINADTAGFNKVAKYLEV